MGNVFVEQSLVISAKGMEELENNFATNSGRTD